METSHPIANRLEPRPYQVLFGSASSFNGYFLPIWACLATARLLDQLNVAGILGIVPYDTFMFDTFGWWWLGLNVLLFPVFVATLLAFFLKYVTIGWLTLLHLFCGILLFPYLVSTDSYFFHYNLATPLYYILWATLAYQGSRWIKNPLWIVFLAGALSSLLLSVYLYVEEQLFPSERYIDITSALYLTYKLIGIVYGLLAAASFALMKMVMHKINGPATTE